MGNVCECVLGSYTQHSTRVLTSLGSMVFGPLGKFAWAGMVVGKALDMA